MKQLFTVLMLTAMIFSHPLAGQMKVLFVDDSDDTFLNAEGIYQAVEAAGYPATYFNAVDSSRGPSSVYMSSYDLVIWQTSNDGTKLSLWNSNDEENIEIKKYLDGGGRMWIGGLDFLFDKYGVAPKTFVEGEFMYDYAGIQSYDVQTYGDDGGIGVGSIYPDDQSPIQQLPEIKWNFPTLWWVDGVTPRSLAKPIYRMDGANYIFKDKICAVLHSAPSFEVLTSFYDLGVAFDTDLMRESVLPILTYFENRISKTQDQVNVINSVNIYPNPIFDGQINVSIELKEISDVAMKIVDIDGCILAILSPVQTLLKGNHTFSYDISGILHGTSATFLSMTIDDEPVTMPIIVQN